MQSTQMISDSESKIPFQHTLHLRFIAAGTPTGLLPWFLACCLHNAEKAAVLTREDVLLCVSDNADCEKKGHLGIEKYASAIASKLCRLMSFWLLGYLDV